MIAVWEDIKGYEGLYQVSNCGDVRSLDRAVPYGVEGAEMSLTGRLLRPCTHKISGHLQVSLYKENKGKTKRICNLVAEAFLGPRPEGKEVLHGIKRVSDDSVSNLTYGTHQENALDCRRDGTHGGRAVVRDDGEEFMSVKVAAEETGGSRTCIQAVLSGRQKTSGGHSWRYK